jgi:hypothetical protein
MEPTAELEALMREWHDARHDAEAANEREDRIKNAVRGSLGDHAGAEGPGWKVTHRLVAGANRTDWRSVAQVMYTLAGVEPELYDAEVAKHTSTSDGARRLVPTWKEEGRWT